MDVFEYITPEKVRAPILVSVPHSGTVIPPEIAEKMNHKVMDDLDDTDWYVDRLYNFVTSLGLPVIKANYSRYVIDLNRRLDDSPLYNDGRKITGLTPLETFSGEPIYNGRPDIDVNDRIDNYYKPYYSKIESVIQDLRRAYSDVLLFDAHSIRHFVPSISKEPFPDMILSDQDHRSCRANIFESFYNVLVNSSYQTEDNSMFKGGNITRLFGSPENGIHALQLEMSKLCYMDDEERAFSASRAKNVTEILYKGFEQLIYTLTK